MLEPVPSRARSFKLTLINNSMNEMKNLKKMKLNINENNSV